MKLWKCNSAYWVIKPHAPRFRARIFLQRHAHQISKTHPVVSVVHVEHIANELDLTDKEYAGILGKGPETLNRRLLRPQLESKIPPIK